MSSATSNNQSYRRVSSQDGGSQSSCESNHNRAAPAGSTSPSTSESNPPVFGDKRVSIRLWNKFIAFCWIAAAIVVAYFTQIYQVLLTSGSTNSNTRQPIRMLLQLAASCFVTDFALLMYLVVYLRFAKGLTDSSAWPVYCPRVIPSMMVFGAVGMLLTIRGIWPIWGCLSPFILGTQVMGAVFSLHFVPWWFNGNYVVSSGLE